MFKTRLLLVATTISIFILISSILSTTLGLQYDEVLFVNAARGGLDNNFITYQWNNIPVLLMPYIGALKSYLYYPYLKIVHANEFNIRIVTILLGSFSILILYKAISKFVSPAIGVVTLLLLAFDTNMIAFNTFDVGPNSIELLIKAISIYLCFKIIEQTSLKNVFWLFFCFFLGTFNKLNFIWFINELAFLFFIYILILLAPLF